jgi:diguanylate cyclase (GGDEF)-like protein
MLAPRHEAALRSRRAFPVRGLARRVSDFHWLNLILGLAYVVIPGIAVRDMTQVGLVHVFYAAFVLLAHYRSAEHVAGPFNLALDTWIMTAYISFMIWQTGENSDALMPLLLIPTAITSIGHTRRLAACHVLLMVALMLGLRWHSLLPLDSASVIGISRITIFGLMLLVVSALIGGFKLDSLLASGQLRQIMDRDELTGLLNGKAFIRLGGQVYQRARLDGAPLSLLASNIRGLREINDSRGMRAANQAIKTVAAVIANTIRETDLASRIGEDEFIVMLPVADRVKAEEVAQRIRNAVAQANFRLEGSLLRGGLNIGIATFPRDAGALSELIQAAKQAMQRDKPSQRPPMVAD